ncbi:MAG: ribosomal protein L7/L12 [Planctomycetota bacterium]|nr:ribosomal protein L7/L12 [Planctomycetota bacterium]
MSTQIPEDKWSLIRAALADGRKIEAIKLYREFAGVGLKEAKDAVERLEAEPDSGPPTDLPASTRIPEDGWSLIRAALADGRKIEAIKLYREFTGVGLKEAKDAVGKLEKELRAASPGKPTAPAVSKGCIAAFLLALAVFWRACLLPQPVRRSSPAQGASSAPVRSGPAQGAPKAPVSAGPAEKGDDERGIINLLSLVNPETDTVAGKWELKDGALRSDGSPGARLQIPFEPPEEYDFRVEFTRLEGNSTVNMLMSKGRRYFGWTMGWNNNTVLDFFNIAGPKSTQTVVKAALENGRRYKATIQVRNDGLKALVDGQLLAQWPTNYGDMSRWRGWDLRDNRLLGLGTWESPTVFHAIEVLEVTGKGRAIRAEAPALGF